jgi:hypothetical protein
MPLLVGQVHRCTQLSAGTVESLLRSIIAKPNGARDYLLAATAFECSGFDRSRLQPSVSCVAIFPDVIGSQQTTVARSYIAFTNSIDDWGLL